MDPAAKKKRRQAARKRLGLCSRGRKYLRKWPRRRAFATLILMLMVLGTLPVPFLYYNFKAATYDLNEVARDVGGARVFDRDGNDLGRVLNEGRVPIAFKDLPKSFVQALIATEDSRFFWHDGNDLGGVGRAAWANYRSKRVRQGASTITQQLARQVFLSDERTYDRKITEIFLARRIEKMYSKKEILEAYANRIYLGSGATGVGAAAELYFGKSARDMNVAESALLCGIIKRPAAFSPFVNAENALGARNRTLDRMGQMGFFSAEDLQRWKSKPLGILPPEQRLPREFPYLSKEIANEARRIFEKMGRLPDGCTIRTGASMEFQYQTMQVVKEGLRQIEQRPGYDFPQGELQAGVVVMDHRSGKILAVVGGRDFAASSYDRAFQSKRPPGTAFTPLVYGAAFSKPGLLPTSIFYDAPLDNRKVMIGGTGGVLGEWCSEKRGTRYEGEVRAAFGLLRNRAATTVRIGGDVGLGPVREAAAQAGIETKLKDYPATLLGSSELTLLELTHAYAIFPGLGKAAPEPNLVEQILDPHGVVLYNRRGPVLKQVIEPMAAEQVTRVLQASMQSPPLKTICDLHGLRGDQVAGKSGSTYHFTDGWFVGYNAEVVCGVWVGFDKPRNMGQEAFGRELALPIWAKVMNTLGEAGPLPACGQGTPCLICLKSGLLATEQCRDEHGSMAVRMPLPDGAIPAKICNAHTRVEPLVKVRPALEPLKAPVAPEKMMTGTFNGNAAAGKP